MAIKVTPGPASSAASRARAEAVQLARRDQLTRVRSAAQNWRNGLAALLALLITFGFTKGRTELQSLADGYAVVAGLAMLTSFSAVAVGAYFSIRAAYGLPRLLFLTGDKHEFEQLEGQLVKTAIRDLRIGIALGYLALALLPVAVGIVWFGPSDRALQEVIAGPKAERQCGEVVSSKDGALVIEPSDGTAAATVPYADIQSIRSVDECK